MCNCFITCLRKFIVGIVDTICIVDRGIVILMTINRINPIKANLGYCLENPFKVDISQFFQELGRLGYKKRQQVLGIDNDGKPARLETVSRNTTTVEYNDDKGMIVLRNPKVIEKDVDEIENVLFDKLEVMKDDFKFLELLKVDLILTDKMALKEIGKYNNKNIINELNSIFSQNFQSGNIRVISTNNTFDKEIALNAMKDYFEINISPYVPRPEYYLFQIVLRGKYDYVKKNIPLIDDRIKETITYIEGEN